MTEAYPAALEVLAARFAPDWPRIIDVGPGWYALLMELDECLVQIAPRYVIHQVKSKFGALVFYAAASLDPYDYVDQFRERIEAAEWRSIEMCEECGEPAGQYTIRMWVWTLCGRHAQERSSD